MKKKRYSNVAEMIRDAAGDNEVATEIEHDIQRRTIVKHLMAMRAVKGLTQADIAQKMGCTQSRVSKLESGTDDDLKLADLRDYLHAIGHDIMLVFATRNTSLVSQIKWHVAMIKGGLQRLVGLAKGDKSIEAGVTKAYADTITDVLKAVMTTAKKLPLLAHDLPQVVEMDGPSDTSDDSDDCIALAAIS